MTDARCSPAESPSDYYREALGLETSRFEANLDHNGYATRDGCHLHFAHFEGARPLPNRSKHRRTCSTRTSGSTTSTRCTAELAGRGAQILHGRVGQGCGLREIRLRDPEGYILAE